MPKDAPFEQHSGRHEAWFDAHDAAYVSELLALRIFVPLTGRGLEIGVGSGRFAAALGIRMGLDPSFAMAVPALLSRSKRLLYGAALLSALAEPAGAIVRLVAAGFAPGLNGHLMSFAAMTFVSLHELLPTARRHGHTLLFGAGLIASVVVYWAVAAFVLGATF